MNEPDPYDDFDEPDWDDQSPERDPDLDYENHLARMADEAEDAYRALPWWRRAVHDWRAWRSRRRSMKRLRQLMKHAAARPGTYNTEAPF